MWPVEQHFKIRIGSNTFSDVTRLIDYKGTSLFTVTRRESDGLLGIDFDLYDAHGKCIANVRHGNIVSGDRTNYEITNRPHHYTMIERSTGRVVCDIRRRDAASDAELELSVDLFAPDGFHFIATPDGTNFGGVFMRDSTITNCQVGIALG